MPYIIRPTRNGAEGAAPPSPRILCMYEENRAKLLNVTVFTWNSSHIYHHFLSTASVCMYYELCAIISEFGFARTVGWDFFSILPFHLPPPPPLSLSPTLSLLSLSLSLSTLSLSTLFLFSLFVSLSFIFSLISSSLSTFVSRYFSLSLSLSVCPPPLSLSLSLSLYVPPAGMSFWGGGARDRGIVY